MKVVLQKLFRLWMTLREEGFCVSWAYSSWREVWEEIVKLLEYCMVYRTVDFVIKFRLSVSITFAIYIV
jgi:hypothetical protein